MHHFGYCTCSISVIGLWLQEADWSIFVTEFVPKSEYLSARERQIAEAYAGGQSYRRIAEQLFIAPTTVRTHLSTIYRKLGVSSKIELLRALESGADGPAANLSPPDPPSLNASGPGPAVDTLNQVVEDPIQTLPGTRSTQRGRADASVTELLGALDLHQYADVFAENAVDLNVLMTLTDSDLRELGVQAIGHRRRLAAAIDKRRSRGATGIEGSASEPPAPVIGPLAERRHLTIVFVALVGSMELSSRLDPEQMQELLADYHKTVAKQAARFRGHVANVMGDEMLVSFGWPNAHEDDAERAVRASLAIRASVGTLRGPLHSSLAVRIGIASGLVIVGEGLGREPAIAGDAPNLASRLQALANPGQIVIAASTRRLLGDIFELADLGTKSVEGVGEPVQRFAVTGERPVESRFDARSGTALLPMVGRDQELALLLERWALAKAGEGQGLLLVGEAGIGKSRICRALLDALSTEPHTRIRYQCSPYHSDSALWPVMQQLTHAGGIKTGVPAEVSLDRLETLLCQAGDHALDAAPLIADLLGLDGAPRYGELNLTAQAKRVRTLQALVDQLLGLASRQPVLLILEDAHWIDPTTLELLEQCLDRIAAARVLLLLTSRSDQQPELAGRAHVTRLTLNRLGRASVEAIVAQLSGDHLPGQTVDAIIARTDGVPLFVEELTKAVLETGETAVPASLHDSLMARLDRIPGVKEVAQTAACIGREFDYVLLSAIADQPAPALTLALDKLARSELIFRRGTPPDSRYIFKHALVQDAASQSLLRSRRRQIHARIAAVLAQRFPHTEPETLAHHLTEAGLHRAAVPQWYAAGQLSMRRSAYREASAHYRRGLDTLQSVPDRAWRSKEEITLQNALGLALIPTSGPLAIDAYARAKELAEQIGDRRELFTALWGLWIVYHFLLEPEREAGIVRELFGMVEQDQDQNHVLQAHHAAWTTGWRRAEFLSADQHARTGLRIYEPDKHRAHADIYAGHDPGVCCRWTLGLTSWFLGFPDQAEAWLAEALALARRLEHPFTLLCAHMRYSYIHQFRREPGLAQEHAQAAMRLCDEQGLPFYQPGLMAVDGWATTALGDPTGLARIREGLATAETRSRRPYLFALLAQACLLAGENDEGLAATRAATEQVRSGGERFWEAEIHRLHGVLLAVTDTAGAEARLMTACEVARQQKAKSLELRAARDLARLWADQGERQEAQNLLAPVYEWFTEGFDTPDLIDAKELLDGLP